MFAQTARPKDNLSREISRALAPSALKRSGVFAWVVCNPLVLSSESLLSALLAAGRVQQVAVFAVLLTDRQSVFKPVADFWRSYVYCQAH
jgi:hypothetical protein